MDKELDDLNTDTDIANDLSAAFDAAEAQAQEEPENVGHQEVSSDIRERAADPDSDPAGGPAAADDSGVPGHTEPDNAASAGDSPAVDAPPISLPPDAREVWKDTPPAMKVAIAKREADYAKGVEKYRTNAERAQQMDGVLGQYQQYFAMQGTPPGQTINSLLQTASLLQMGTPMQRAQTVAQLINQFGVDIGALDSLLAGEAVPRGTTDDVQQRINEALQPFQGYVQQIEQQRQREAQQTQNRIGTELQQFAAKNEFYNDVANDMADFLDVAARNGRQMTLDEAYQRACMAHPSISQIVAARNKAPTPQQQAAASTLRGSGLGGPGEAADPSDIRSAIEMAWGDTARL
jgi:hypothetical protein